MPASTSQNDEGDLAPARKKGAEMRQNQGPLACTDRPDAALRDGVYPVASRAEMHPQRDRHCTGTQTRHHAAASRTRLCAANAIFLGGSGGIMAKYADFSALAPSAAGGDIMHARVWFFRPRARRV
jgi:hypothetical protein